MNDLDSAIKLLYKTNNDKLLNSLIKQGKIDYRVKKLLNDEALCETFKWTYKELQETDLFILDAFSQILDTRAKLEREELEKKQGKINKNL